MFMFEPFGNRIYAEYEELGDRKIGSIIITNTEAERTRIVKVLAVGPEVQNPAIKVGARLVVGIWGGVEIYAPKYGDATGTKRIFVEGEIFGLFEEK